MSSPTNNLPARKDIERDGRIPPYVLFRDPDSPGKLFFRDDSNNEHELAGPGESQLAEVDDTGESLGTLGTLRIVRDAEGSYLEIETSAGERVAIN